MTKQRASIFGDDASDLDVSGFVPKAKTDAKAPAAAAVKAVTENANFRSREAAPPPPPVEASASPKRSVRYFRTGRNVQFNVKALQETVDAIYDVSEAQGWVLGYTLERAMAALKRELEPAS